MGGRRGSSELAGRKSELRWRNSGTLIRTDRINRFLTAKARKYLDRNPIPPVELASRDNPEAQAPEKAFSFFVVLRPPPILVPRSRSPFSTSVSFFSSGCRRHYRFAFGFFPLALGHNTLPAANPRSTCLFSMTSATPKATGRFLTASFRDAGRAEKRSGDSLSPSRVTYFSE